MNKKIIENLEKAIEELQKISTHTNRIYSIIRSHVNFCKEALQNVIKELDKNV